jgi:hypothetical protein
MLRTCYFGFGVGEILWNDLLKGSRTRHLQNLNLTSKRHPLVPAYGVLLPPHHRTVNFDRGRTWGKCCGSPYFKYKKICSINFKLLRHHQHHHHLLCSPGSDLAFLSKCRQRPLSWASARQFLQPNFLASPSTPSIHLDFGLPRPR